MTTVTWSVLYLGQYADMDPDEAGNFAENASQRLTTYGGASDPLFHHVTTLSVVSDEDPRAELDSHQIGALDTITYDLGAGPVTTQIDSGGAFGGSVTFHDGTTFNSTFAVIQDQQGRLFLLLNDTQPELAAKAVDSLTLTSVVKTDYSGVELFTRDDLAFVCFTTGTLIDTPSGPRRVEDLAEGDLVRTADRGARPIRWIGRRDAPLRGPGARDRPIRIRAGALGGGAPARDLTVSPRHRVLLRAEDPRGPQGDLLCAALFLDGAPGIGRCMATRTAEYHALLLDRHEILFAEGAAVESFHPGPYARRLLPARMREEIHARFPALAADPDAAPGPLARPELKRGQARALLRRLAKGKARLVETEAIARSGEATKTEAA